MKTKVEFSWGDAPYTYVKRVIRALRRAGKQKQANKLLEKIVFAVLDDSRQTGLHERDFPGCGPGDILKLCKEFVTHE